jgi:tetratricopeptide (TPR) repeat protein
MSIVLYIRTSRWETQLDAPQRRRYAFCMPKSLGAACRLLALALVTGCATTGNGELSGSGRPVPKITTDEEFGEARTDFTAIPTGSPSRAEWRKALLTYLLPRVDDLAARDNDDAIEVFKNACSLWEPEELEKPDTPKEMARRASMLADRFARRGAEEPVILGLSVAATLDPSQRGRWEERLRWIEEFESSAGGSAHRWTKVIEALEATMRVWPSPLVADKLAGLYLDRHAALLRAIRRGARGNAADLVEGQESGATHTAYKLAALWLRVGKPDRAREALTKIADQPGDDPLLRQLLAKAQSGKQASDAIELAKYFIREDVADREVAMRICLRAAARFPKDAEPRICAAEMAVTTMAVRAPLAIRLLTEAVRLAPNERAPAETLVRLRLVRLAERMGEDRTRVDGAIADAEDLVHLIEELEQKLGGKPFEPGIADVWFELGQGYYNSGVAGDAEKYLRRSLERRPFWKPWHQLGLLRMKHRQFEEAVGMFDRALGVPSRSLPEGIEMRASVLRDKGEALDRLGRTAEAKQAREGSFEAFTQQIGLVQNRADAARLQVERGRLLYDVGRPREGIDAFEKAIDFMPERAETYADVLAFLVPRGHLREAMDAYHRALGRHDISDYIKVYASLWVTDLARRQKEPPDPLAEQYLKSVDGKRWFDDLARFASGRITWQQLIGRADTPGKQAEAYFYQAQRLLSSGREEQAKELWKKVLSTDMMAFFEYEMADYYLRRGAPTRAPTLPPADRPDRKPVGDAI